MKQSYKAVKNKSGSGTSNVTKPVWLFCHSLCFLVDNANPRDTICNIFNEVPWPEKKKKKWNKKGSQV